MICWWVGLCSLLVSCLVWGDSAWGLWALSGSWWPPRGFMSRGTFQDCCCQHPVPVVSHCLPVPPQETLPHQLAVSVQSPVWFGSVFFCMLLCTGFCLCPPRLESLLSPVLWKSYNQTCWPSSSDSLGIPSSFIGSPGCEAWCGFQNLHNSGRTSLVLLFTSLLFTHPADMGFDFSCLHSSYCLTAASSLSLDVVYLFLVGSSILLLMIVQQLVVILVLSQEEVSAYLSTLPFWTRNYTFNFYCCTFPYCNSNTYIHLFKNAVWKLKNHVMFLIFVLNSF